jgi:hypothetical protein
MFGSNILDVAIGLVFVFLFLSLICSALNELLESLLKNRGRDLERGIRELLGDREGAGLAKALYMHPLISALYRGEYEAGGKQLPSYIPARNFALALMDVVLPAERPRGAAVATPAAETSPPKVGMVGTGDFALFRDAIGKLANPHVQRALMTLVEAAGNDARKTRESIELWYNGAMDRVSGWYKRRVQTIILLLGLSLAAGLNVDSITVVKSLSVDKALRDSLVAATQEYAKKQPSADLPDRPVERVQANLAAIERLGLPIGWPRDDPRLVPSDVRGWGLKVVGWLLTACAVSLGAPFWFDLLNKIILVRSSVKPKEKSTEG